MRRSSLDHIDVSISREIDSKFDSVKIVADHISEVETVAGLDMTEVSGEIVVLNQELQVIKDQIDAGGLIGPQGIQGIRGTQGVQGIAGPQGIQGGTGSRGYTIKPTFAFKYDSSTGDIIVDVENELYDESQILNEFSSMQPREV